MEVVYIDLFGASNLEDKIKQDKYKGTFYIVKKRIMKIRDVKTYFTDELYKEEKYDEIYEEVYL